MIFCKKNYMISPHKIHHNNSFKMSCNICVENFNKNTRTKVSCEFCSYEACKSCWKTYFLSINEHAKCMNSECEKYFTRKALAKNFDDAFLNNAYKNHVGDMLIQTEKNLLPLTQKDAEAYKENEIIKQKQNEIKQKMKALKKELTEMELQYRELKRKENQLYNKKGEIEKEEKNTFMKKCPRNECRGFLSTQWKCGVCNLYTCKECHEPMNDEHKCNPQTLETIKMLEKDTKNCPSCSSLVYKINGCDQMFCVICKTAFDWKTKRIIKGVIHNPHYFEWIRNNPQGNNPQANNPQENECVYFNQQFPLFYRGTLSELETFHEFCRKILHIENETIPMYRPENIQSLNKKARIQYLMKEIDEKKFKQIILKNNKKNELNIEITQLLTLYTNLTIDILRRFRVEYKKNNTRWTLSEHKNEQEKVKKYVLKCVKETLETFGSSIKGENLFE